MAKPADSVFLSVKDLNCFSLFLKFNQFNFHLKDCQIKHMVGLPRIDLNSHTSPEIGVLRAFSWILSNRFTKCMEPTEPLRWNLWLRPMSESVVLTTLSAYVAGEPTLAPSIGLRSVAQAPISKQRPTISAPRDYEIRALFISGKSIVKPVGEVICIRKFYLPGIPIM